MSLSEWIKDGCKNMNSFLEQQNIEQSGGDKALEKKR